MSVKTILNPLSGREKVALLKLSKICREKNLLESRERKLLFQAGKYPNWFIRSISSFIDAFKSVWNTDELKSEVNIDEILSKTNKSFLQKVKNINQIVSIADTYNNQVDELSGIQAFEFYKAAQTKSARAMFEIANYYYYGTPKNFMELNYKERKKLIDYQKARVLYEKAAKKKNNEALLYLGNIFAGGLGVEKDLKLALIYYEKFINNVETHSFIFSNLVKCLTDILWERLATKNNNFLEINIKTKKDIDDCKKCKDHIKKSISFLEESIEYDYYDSAQFYYNLAYMYALGSRFLPGGYEIYYEKASDNFYKACEIDSDYEDLTTTILDSHDYLSYLFKDGFKISKQVHHFEQSKDRHVQGNVITINKFKQNKEKFDDAWVDNKLKQGESLTLEFKERIYFVHNNENNSRDVIINASSLKIARLVCGFLNSTIYENAYIIFGVSDKAKIIDKDDFGVKADLTFFEKDFKNKTEKDFKIIDRIIQNLREKLCFLLEKQNVASYINFHEKLYRKQIRLVIIEIKKSNQPIFIKYNSKIFTRASEHKQEPERQPEIFNEETYTNGLFVRSSRDIDYFKGHDLYEFFKINFGNTGAEEDY